MPEVTDPVLDQPHVIRLPSKGLPYLDDRGQALLPDGQVKVRPMTGEEDAMLASNLTVSEKLVRLIAACAPLPPGLSELSLLHADAVVLLTSIRVATYGTHIPVSAVCPYCDHRFSHTLNVATDLVQETLPRVVKGQTYSYDARQGIEIELPVCKKKCKVSLPTAGDDVRVSLLKPSNLPEFARKNPEWYMRKVLAIREFDGRRITHAVPSDLHAIMEVIRSLHVKDIGQIDAAIKRHSPYCGIVGQTSCPSCKEEVTVPIGLSLDFFRDAEVDAE